MCERLYPNVYSRVTPHHGHKSATDICTATWAVMGHVSDSGDLRVYPNATLFKFLATSKFILPLTFGYPNKAASMIDSSVRYESNVCIRFNNDGPYDGDTTTPDLAFEKLTSDGPLYSLIVESGYSKSSDKLEKVALRHLNRREVVGVITVKFSCTAFSNPTAISTARPVSASAFRPQAKISPLGPIKYLGHKWASRIKEIHMKIFTKNTEGEDVTPDPSNDNLADHQAEVATSFRSLLQKILGKQDFDSIFPEDGSCNIN
ncbi:hypothetical protein C8J57DRAFT_1238454 [Mycena rebaudengoi]|nr:hypothetical protein C8J57DRAFT_1238454 [Mycena rebaudengoi]